MAIVDLQQKPIKFHALMAIVEFFKPMTTQKPKSKKPDFHFEVNFELSEKLEEFVTSMIELSKVGITIGKILIPPLLAAAIALQQVTPPSPLPPESTQQNK
jgi:hypothetical protein